MAGIDYNLNTSVRIVLLPSALLCRLVGSGCVCARVLRLWHTLDSIAPWALAFSSCEAKDAVRAAPFQLAQSY